MSGVTKTSQAGSNATTLSELFRKSILKANARDTFENPKEFKAIVIRQSKISLRDFVQDNDFDLVKYTLGWAETYEKLMEQIDSANTGQKDKHAFVYCVTARVPDIDFLPFDLGPNSTNTLRNDDSKVFNDFIIEALVHGASWNDPKKMESIEKEYKNKIPMIQNITKRVRRFPKFYYHPGLMGSGIKFSNTLPAGSKINIVFLNENFDSGVCIGRIP